MKILVGIILTLLLGTMFISLFHMSSGMNMDGSMRDCPYMTHESTVCPMSFFDHVTAWKTTFASLTPSIFILAGLLMVVVVSLAPNLFVRGRLWLLKTRVVSYHAGTDSFIARPLQELFSNGILHPKLF